MLDQTLVDKVKKLPPAERLELIGELRESLDLADLAVTDEEKAVLDARIEDEAKNPSDVAPWSEVEARLRKRLR